MYGESMYLAVIISDVQFHGALFDGRLFAKSNNWSINNSRGVDEVFLRVGHAIASAVIYSYLE